MEQLTWSVLVAAIGGLAGLISAVYSTWKEMTKSHRCRIDLKTSQVAVMRDAINGGFTRVSDIDLVIENSGSLQGTLSQSYLTWERTGKEPDRGAKVFPFLTVRRGLSRELQVDQHDDEPLVIKPNHALKKSFVFEFDPRETEFGFKIHLKFVGDRKARVLAGAILHAPEDVGEAAWKQQSNAPL